MPRLVPALAAGALAALGGLMVLQPPAPRATTYAADGRLVAVSGRPQVGCPKQTQRTAIILAIGQSNIANHAEARLQSRHPGRSFATFEGACTELQSPLLGASGSGGEFLTPMADLLLDDDVFDTVVVAPAAVGGTSIAQWLAPPLKDALLSTVHDAVAKYRITHVLWQQGESDTRMPAADYVSRFAHLRDLLDETGVDAPIYVAVSTYCLPMNARWEPDNPAALALRSLPGHVPRTRAGPDLDRYTGEADRIEHCHLSASGQLIVAREWAAVLAGDRKAESASAPAGRQVRSLD